MSRVRIVERADGGVSVIRAFAPRDPEQSDDAYYTPIFEDAQERDEGLKGRPFLDMDESELPSRDEACPDDTCPHSHHAARDTWRMKDGGLVIDPDVPNPHRLSAHLGVLLDRELDADAPDAVRLARIQRAKRLADAAAAGGVPAEAAQAAYDRLGKD